MPSIETPPSAKPSVGYLLTLSLGCIGLTFIGIGLGGAVIARAGGDPIRAMNTDGIPMFLLGFAVAFAMRLIFWPRAPASLRSTVRTLISALFLICIPLALLGLALAFQLPSTLKHVSAPIYFSTLALVCQLGSVFWLFRYRREGF